METNCTIESTPSDFFNSVKEFNQRYSVSSHKPSLKKLQEILYYFSGIPYENMSKIIKLCNNFDDINKIRYPDEVLQDHFRYNLGGTCFSITFLLKTILTFHGFNNYVVMADMNWGRNVHCAIVVTHDSQDYLVDPGYLLSQPLSLPHQKSVITRTSFSGVKLEFIKKNNYYNLYTFNNKILKWRYKFINRPVSEKEFFEFWLSSFQWNSMNSICIASVCDNEMIYIHRNFMRKTTFYQKKNFNLKKNFTETISSILKINPQKIEEALESVEMVKQIKKERGLWKPA